MTYAREMADRLPSTLPLSAEFRALFEWMEANGHFMASQAYPGDKLGLLGTRGDMDADRVTVILFRVATAEQAREYGEAWFGQAVPNIEERLVPFARSGGDGSHVAFWQDEQGHHRVVHLGSEGQVCLLGRTPLDFLRLLAIGYQEISGDCLEAPEEPPIGAGRNVAYRAWLTDRYGVAVPDNAGEILGEIPHTLAETSDDPFWRWVQKMQGAER